MSKPGKQFSLVGGIGSGAGALSGIAATDQTGNLLNIDPTVHTPNVMVGHARVNNKGRKKQFGGTTAMSGNMFNYPDLAVKNPQGNGQSYRASNIGYLPGNNNAGAAGFGVSREFDRSTMVSGDLTDAYKKAELTERLAQPEHFRTVNRDYETVREHFEEQKKEHELEKITHLMAMGFSEAEIQRKVEKDREKAIEQASNMDRSSQTLEKAIMRAMPITDIGISVAPGLVPQRMNADSYQRATGLGTPVTKGKAFEAMRRRERMGMKIDAEKPEIKAPMKHSAIVQMMMGIATKEDHKRQESSLVKAEQVVHHQKLAEEARLARNFAMSKAMEKK